LYEAIAALSKTSDLINGRDFVPQGGENWRKAINEHKERLKKLQDVHKEIEFIIESIDNQTGGR
jgi:hypothetical protein